MEKREKNKNIIVFGIVMAISLSVALNIGNIFGGIGTFFKILNPIILGCMLAVIFNVPMEALSRQLEKLSKKVKFLRKEKARNGISLVVTIVIVVLVFAVIMWSIIPDLIESITGFIKNFDNNVNVNILRLLMIMLKRLTGTAYLKSLERLPEHFSRAYLRVFHR